MREQNNDSHTNKRQDNSFKETSMNDRVDVILVTYLASEMTKHVDWTCEEAATNTTDTVHIKFMLVTADEL